MSSEKNIAKLDICIEPYEPLNARSNGHNSPMPMFTETTANLAQNSTEAKLQTLSETTAIIRETIKALRPKAEYNINNIRHGDLKKIYLNEYPQHTKIPNEHTVKAAIRIHQQLCQEKDPLIQIEQTKLSPDERLDILVLLAQYELSPAFAEFIRKQLKIFSSHDGDRKLPKYFKDLLVRIGKFLDILPPIE